jgi:hypothetical protein
MKGRFKKGDICLLECDEWLYENGICRALIYLHEQRGIEEAREGEGGR